MSDFDFDKFEQNIEKFKIVLKSQIQTRCFNEVAPAFDLEVNVYEQGEGRDKKIKFETSDIAHRMKFKMFKEIGLCDFGSYLGKGEASDLYCLSIHWWYTHFDGGNNGFPAFTLWFNDSGDAVKVHQP